MLANPAHLTKATIDPLMQAGRALRCLVDLDGGAAGEGPLRGLTYLAKDLFDTPGRAATCGLAIAGSAVPARKAAALAALDDAGAGRRGFAEMTALACEPSGSNPGRQRPLNPWNPVRICGGSSSGSAVAVAAGLVDFALGSDTAGSLRIPAHCCGVTAWKPTPGLVPPEGAMALAPALDVLGFLSREASTLLAVAGVFGVQTTPGRPARIAPASDLIAQAHPEIAAACEAVATHLAQSGHIIAAEPLAPLLKACDAAVLDLLQAETSAQHGWRLARSDLDPLLAARLTKGLAITPQHATDARETLRAIAGALSIFRRHDAILLPVMPILTPEIAACEPGSPAFTPRTLYALSAFTRFVNALGLPAVALPCGFDNHGMPVAAQLVGAPGSDPALLRLAADIQSRTHWHDRDPAALRSILEAAR